MRSTTQADQKMASVKGLLGRKTVRHTVAIEIVAKANGSPMIWPFQDH